LYSPTSYAGNSALVPTQLGNQGIKWESTKEVDLGLDMSLLGDRLNATFDYYNKQTSGDLFWLPVAASSSYSSLLENAVGLRNRGFEASMGGTLIRVRDFSWTASINVTWNNSLVTRLDPRADLSQIKSLSGFEFVSDSINNFTGNVLILPGKPLGLITGQIITGIIKTQAELDAYNRLAGGYFPAALQIGDPIYKLDASTASSGYEDKVHGAVIANGPPKYFGGMTQEFSYKRFGVRCYFTFSHGGHLLWPEHVAGDEFFDLANAGRSMLNRYTPANPNSNYPALSYNDYYSPTNLDVFGSSYFKLRSLLLTCRFDPSGRMKRTGIKSAQVFVSATNVFTITKYPGSDPETVDDPYSVSGGYIDTGNYPAIRTFSLGVKATF
jgi:hypothetical protein